LLTKLENIQSLKCAVSWLMLMALICSLFCVPYLSYKVWRHQYRMSFKSEATNYYTSRPELFKTFAFTEEFQAKIQILKPNKEFALDQNKFDVLDTIFQDQRIIELVCVQDEDEMYLEQLVREHTQQDHSSKTASTTQEWIKIYKWFPSSGIGDAFAPPPYSLVHHAFLKQLYTSPNLDYWPVPPQETSMEFFI
jgi:hypothetical protein